MNCSIEAKHYGHEELFTLLQSLPEILQGLIEASFDE